MCSRIEYETGTGTTITGRGMDWNDPTAQTQLWAFPKGMNRDGGVGATPIQWVSQHGSVIASFYDAGTADGMNEAGLVVNMLYLVESDYGDPAVTGKPTLSVGAWAQYVLDNFATVADAVAGSQPPPYTVVAPTLPNGRAAAVHLSLSDSSGDSAIFEFIDGDLVIHHGSQFRVMTNSPVFDQQLALNTYWDLVGGNRMLPGTINAADRFVRLSYYIKSVPKYEDRTTAVAAVFSMVRAIGTPLGMEDPDHPNISATLWRTVSDHDAKRYYFESTLKPSVLWVDLDNLDLAAGAPVMAVNVLGDTPLAGEVSAEFADAEPFAWLRA